VKMCRAVCLHQLYDTLSLAAEGNLFPGLRCRVSAVQAAIRGGEKARARVLVMQDQVIGLGVEGLTREAPAQRLGIHQASNALVDTNLAAQVRCRTVAPGVHDRRDRATIPVVGEIVPGNEPAGYRGAGYQMWVVQEYAGYAHPRQEEDEQQPDVLVQPAGDVEEAFHACDRCSPVGAVRLSLPTGYVCQDPPIVRSREQADPRFRLRAPGADRSPWVP
jgi:hypothetical protein